MKQRTALPLLLFLLATLNIFAQPLSSFDKKNYEEHIHKVDYNLQFVMAAYDSFGPNGKHPSPTQLDAILRQSNSGLVIQQLATEPTISVLVKVSKAFDPSAHPKVQWTSGKLFEGKSQSFITAILSIKELPELIKDQELLQIAADSYVENIDMPANELIQAPEVWTANLANGEEVITGENVYVGIIEKERLRATHLAFNQNNTCRIERLWIYNNDGNPAIHSDCSSYPFQHANLNTERANHATNVSSIAAGDGFPGCNDCKGLAYESDILFASINTNNEILTAIEAMANHVNGSPLAINISLSILRGPRDGSTNYEDAFNQGLAFYPNVHVIAGAANNARKENNGLDAAIEGQEGYPHFSGTIEDVNTALTFTFKARALIEKDLFLEIWHDGNISVEVISNGLSSGEVQPGNFTFHEVSEFGGWNTPDSIYIYNGQGSLTQGPSDQTVAYYPNSNNASWVGIRINKHGTFNPFLTDEYQIVLKANNLDSGLVSINAYHNQQNNTCPCVFGGETFRCRLGFERGDSYQSMGLPATASDLITVASHKKSNPNTISNFSSWGPLRTETIADASKPDITAPGDPILGAGSISNSATISQSGTSQAAPHVTGVAALILQHFPNIPNQQLKTLLKQTAQNNGISDYETAKWGAGQLNALSAYKALVGYHNDVTTPDTDFQQTYALFNDPGLPLDPVILNYGNSNHQAQRLSDGILFKNNNLQNVFWIGERIYDAWQQEGGLNGQIGAPISSEYEVSSVEIAANFESCIIKLNTTTGATTIECCTNGNEPNLTYVPNAGILTVDGSVITVSNATFINEGNCHAGEFNVGFFASFNSTITSTDYLLSNQNISALSPGGSIQISFSINLADAQYGLEDGIYYIGFFIDHQDVVAESNETDNTGVWNNSTVILQPNSINCSSAINIQCGDVVSGSNQNGTSNIFNYNCSAWNESGPEVFYKYEQIGIGSFTASLTDLTDDLDIFILDACNENQCISSGNSSATVTDATPGVYYIVVDGYTGSVSDFTLSLSCEEGFSNLIFDQPHSLSTNGSSASATISIKNTGCGSSAGSSTLMAYISQDVNFDGFSEDPLVGYFAVPALAPDEVYTFDIEFDITDLTSEEGAFFLGYFLDYYNDVPEVIENDNSFNWIGSDYQIVNPSSLPNLTEYFSGNDDLTITGGSNLEITNSVVNLGAANAGSFTIIYYLSQSNGSYNHIIHEENFSGLASGDVNNYSFNVNASTLGLSDGIYYVEWRIDAYNTVSESNENDNNWYFNDGPSQVIISESPYCGETNTLTSLSETFSDGSGSEDYTNDTHCYWYINPIGSNQTITFYISQLNTESGYDWIRVYDGASPQNTLLGQFSGSAIPSAVTSTSDRILVSFSSDGTVSSEGFEAGYFVNDLSFCSGLTELFGVEGYFSDGSGCANYQHNANCEWRINPENNNAIVTLTFNEFALEDGDELRIYKGFDENGEHIATYSGLQTPIDVSINGPVYVRFISDETNNNDGFGIFYEVTYLDPVNIAGQIETPNAVPVYGVSVACSGQPSTNSNSNGNYDFNDLDAATDYTLIPNKGGILNEVLDISDYFILASHLAGQNTLTSPYDLIAADLNLSGSVTYDDLGLLYNIIFGNQNSTTIPTWRFVPQDYNFPIPTNPWTEIFPETIVIPEASGNYLAEDFYAIRMGNLFGPVENALPSLITSESRSDNQDTDKALFKLSPNTPNPFRIQTTIPFELPTASPVHVMILDERGRLVYQENFLADSGIQYYYLDGNKLPNSGSYQLLMATNRGHAYQKVILIK